jgi:membrane-bound serine protease (ClpP class)
MFVKMILPIVLQLLGIAVIIAEFIIPSMGILTAVALGLFGYSLYYVFTQISSFAGFVFVIIDICMIPVLIIVGIKLLAASPVTLRSALTAKNGGQSQPPEWDTLIGLSGNALTNLRPSGSALFNGKRYDVVSRGDFIDKGTTVTVVSVDGNRIVVKCQDPETKNQPEEV